MFTPNGASFPEDVWWRAELLLLVKGTFHLASQLILLLWFIWSHLQSCKQASPSPPTRVIYTKTIVEERLMRNFPSLYHSAVDNKGKRVSHQHSGRWWHRPERCEGEWHPPERSGWPCRQSLWSTSCHHLPPLPLILLHCPWMAGTVICSRMTPTTPSCETRKHITHKCQKLSEPSEQRQNQPTTNLYFFLCFCSCCFFFTSSWSLALLAAASSLFWRLSSSSASVRGFLFLVGISRATDREAWGDSRSSTRLQMCQTCSRFGLVAVIT